MTLNDGYENEWTSTIVYSHMHLLVSQLADQGS